MRTKSFIFFLFCTFILCTKSAAYTERNFLQHAMSLENLKQSLVLDQKWVRYPAYQDRDGWDVFFGQYKEEIIKNGEELLNYTWKVVRATDYLEFERSGNREIMENPFDANNQAIVRLMLAELAEGKGRFVDQLINGVFHTCEMTSWALSAHLVRQPSHRALPTPEYPLIDLTAGDLGGFLSWVYYFMHGEFDKIDPEISRRLYHELDERVMKPFLENDSFWWMAIDYKGEMVNNWNPWCNSNCLMTFMLLENDRERLAKAVYRSMESVDKFLNYVHSDGACEEGPSYWGHASGKCLDYLILLNRITGGKISLFDNAQIKAMGEYIARSYVGNGWVVNFADASARGGGDPYMIYRYGKAVNSDILKQFAGMLNQGKTEGISFRGRDLFRMLEALAIKDELSVCQNKYEGASYTWYPETEFCYIRNKKAFFAAKGGYNDESHNHNDAGSFSLWINDMPIMIDAGVGTYTRQTFSSERYSIWTMQSNYHNLPLINGVPQKYGKQYKATEVKATRNAFSANIATAYPEEAKVKRWIRSYLLKSNELVVSDNFELKSVEAENTVNFLTWGDVSVEDGKVHIQVNGVDAVLEYDNKKFKVSKEPIRLTDKKLSDVWGREIYRLSFVAKNKVAKGLYVFKIRF